MNNLDSIYRRLKKLLAIAEDKRANPAEAAAAAAQAEKIMRKFQIDESEILEKEFKQGGDALFSSFDCAATYELGRTGVKIVSKSLSILCVAIAKLNDCQARIHEDSLFGKMIRFQGYKPDVEVCKFTFRYIVGSCIRASRGESSVADFRKGFVLAVVESLKQALADKQADRVVDSRALVVIKKDAVAKHYGEAKYSKTRMNTSDASAAHRGYEAGKKLNALVKGVGHTSSPTKAIQ